MDINGAGGPGETEMSRNPPLQRLLLQETRCPVERSALRSAFFGTMLPTPVFCCSDPIVI